MQRISLVVSGENSLVKWELPRSASSQENYLPRGPSGRNWILRDAAAIVWGQNRDQRRGRSHNDACPEAKLWMSGAGGTARSANIPVAQGAYLERVYIAALRTASATIYALNDAPSDRCVRRTLARWANTACQCHPEGCKNLQHEFPKCLRT